MKFIHTADVHWGMEPDSDKPWSRERAQAIKDTFTQVITRARDLEVDFLFISGDLFHRHDCREPRPDPQQFRCFKFFLVSERDLPHE